MGRPLTTAEEIGTVTMPRPHVVILGAGASRAACPQGDRHGRTLPLMADFAREAGLEPLLGDWGLDPARNFEDIYGELYERGEGEKMGKINRIAEEYLGGLELPGRPTVYDYLILSLKRQDLIVSFNWDPLLIQARRRNQCAGMSVPEMIFPHGNVAFGYCNDHKYAGPTYRGCPACKRPFRYAPPIYPAGGKDYERDPFIMQQMYVLEKYLHDTIMLTVFGYSAPRTDDETVGFMRRAYGRLETRTADRLIFITHDGEDAVRDRWRDFIYRDQLQVVRDFHDSYLAKHPRRVGDAYAAEAFEGCTVFDNPAPRGVGFRELWGWFGRFRAAEERFERERGSYTIN